MHTYKKNKRGFTLVEMTVSLGLFIIVMFIATSAFLSIVNADRKSRAVRIAADNLNISLEDMSRRIKTGTTYECAGAASFPVASTADCSSGANNIAFTDQNSHRVAYRLNGTQIERRIDPETTFTPVTSPEITITSLKFIVLGSALGSADNMEPSVTVAIDGSLGAGLGSLAGQTNFKIQTTITQRSYDN